VIFSWTSACRSHVQTEFLKQVFFLCESYGPLLVAACSSVGYNFSERPTARFLAQIIMHVGKFMQILGRKVVVTHWFVLSLSSVPSILITVPLFPVWSAVSVLR